MDISTYSTAVAGSDGTIWIKLYLDKVHCIKRVKRFLATWTCTKNDCSDCEGFNCDGLTTLTVNTEGTPQSDLPGYSYCRYGDTVKFEKTSGQLHVYEVVIMGKLGNVQT